MGLTPLRCLRRKSFREFSRQIALAEWPEVCRDVWMLGSRDGSVHFTEWHQWLAAGQCRLSTTVVAQFQGCCCCPTTLQQKQGRCKFIWRLSPSPSPRSHSLSPCHYSLFPNLTSHTISFSLCRTFDRPAIPPLGPATHAPPSAFMSGAKPILGQHWDGLYKVPIPAAPR